MGYLLDEKKAGRPNKPEQEVKQRKMNFLVTEDEYELINKSAKKEGFVSVAAYIRKRLGV
jgi:hypothetical protein